MRTICGAVVSFCLVANMALAQNSPPSEISVALGFNGAWKLGHVCPVRVTLRDQIAAKTQMVEISTIDGDGVEVTYRRQVDSTQAGKPVSVPVRIGRESSSLVVRAIGESGVVSELDLDPSDVGTLLPSDQPMVVAIGSSMGIEQLSRTSADGDSETFSTATLSDANELPLDWRDYSFSDLIVISTANSRLLDEISGQQWSALDSWIRRGGGCVVTLGADASMMPQPLKEIIPGDITAVGTIRNPGTVESLVSTNEAIQQFDASILTLARGNVEVSLSDSVGRELPWWVSSSHGHGFVQTIASDLDDPAFAQWSDRKRLWELLMEPYIDRGMTGVEKRGGGSDSSYLGYSDLVGQLRATLDVFSDVKVISFSQLAAVLIAILLVVGPVDYLISIKWLNKPQVSWYFAGGFLLATCAGLAWYYQKIRPDELHINATQIIDIDAQSGKVNGRIWSHVYSGSARTVSIVPKSLNSEAPIFVDWQGLPGRGLGGLLSQLNADRGMPGYRVHAGNDGGSVIEEVGIPGAGTKCIIGTWADHVEMQSASRLMEIPGVDQLSGELVNPLSVNLMEPALFYHNWFYSLNSRIQPGESVAISYDTIPKDMARRLNRRRTIEGSDRITPWDPSDRDSLDRLMELMMFHRAAAGRTYTSLSHRYQPVIDQSNLMKTDHAVLIGRLEQPWAAVDLELKSEGGASAPEIRRDKDRVWCRILIPVAKAD